MSSVDLSQQHAVHSLYKEHHSWLCGWLRKRLGCVDNAADLAQDTFIRVLTQRKAVELREPRAYLSTVARSLMIDMFRRRALEQAYLAELAQMPEAEQPSPELQLLILEDLKAIDRLLGKLSSKARAAFLHNRLDGMGHAEIAERLGVSVSRVRQYIAQGIRQCYVALYGEPT